MTTRLNNKILVFAFFALLIPLALSAYFDVRAIFDSYRNSLTLRLQIHAESLRFAIEKVQNLGLPIAEMEGLGARCQEIVSRDSDVAYCVIESPEGKLLFAHDPSLTEFSSFPSRNPDEAVSLLPEHRDWGLMYDITVPIYDTSMETTGWIRIGFSREVLLDLARAAILKNTLILLGVFITVFVAIVYYLRRHLVKPIDLLCDMASSVSKGDFKVEPPRMNAIEFKALSESLGKMATSLAERDVQIAHSMDELEHANRLLQNAYETQEDISADLKRNQTLYQTLVDQASEAILVCNKNDEIQLFNHQAEKMFGVEAPNIINTNLLSFFGVIGVSDVDPLYEMYQSILESGVGVEEFNFNGANNDARVGLISAVNIESDAGDSMVQMIIHDITREQQAKLNLEKSTAELLRLNRMKNTFLGMVSHELKTPLTIILGYADLIEAQKNLNLPPQLEDSLNHIIQAAERLGRVIQNMVDASDLESQQVELKRSNVDINGLLSRTADEARVYTEKRLQSVTVELDETLPDVIADPMRLEQLCSHLVNNAIKFTPDGGQIKLRSIFLRPGSEGAATCSCNGDRSKGCVEIVVEDSGIGIPEEDREIVFDKFYGSGPIEEHSSGKVSFKGKGVGLGLTIVQGIVELHGGEVWVDNIIHESSDIPKGTSFHVRLPVCPVS